MQRLELGQREREERRVGRVRLRGRDHLCRRGALAQALGELRSHRHRRSDLLRVPPAHFQPLQPLVDLVGRQLPGQRRQPEPPGRDLKPVAVAQVGQPAQQRDRLLVRREMRMDRSVRAELGEPQDRVFDLALGEQRLQLVTQPRRGKVADEPHLDRPAGEPRRVLVHPEAVPVLIADRAEDASGVVDEREVVEHADRPRLEIAPPAEGIDEPAEVGALERDRHRVDREVAAEQVLPDRGVLDGRQRGRSVVELGARGDDVDALVIAVEDDRRPELLVRAHAAAERVGQRLRERDRIALDCDVDVEAALAEQDVADGSADEVDALERLGHGGDRLEHGLQALEPRQLGGQHRPGLDGRRRLLAQRPQEVAAGDDAGDLLVAEHGDAVVSAREQALH